MIRIYVVDDHSNEQEGLAYLVSLESDISLLGSANTGEQAVEEVRKMENKPDVVVMDISLEETEGDEKVDGLLASKRIKRLAPNTKILIFSTGFQRSYVREVIEQGIEGYVIKNAEQGELIRAIRYLHKGEEYYGRQIQSEIVKIVQEKSKGNTPYGLTPRELQVLEVIVKGLKSEEIGDKLNISINTVHTHRRSIHSKMGVTNVVDLINKAREEGLIK